MRYIHWVLTYCFVCNTMILCDIFRLGCTYTFLNIRVSLYILLFGKNCGKWCQPHLQRRDVLFFYFFLFGYTKILHVSIVLLSVFGIMKVLCSKCILQLENFALSIADADAKEIVPLHTEKKKKKNRTKARINSLTVGVHKPDSLMAKCGRTWDDLQARPTPPASVPGGL